MRRLLALVLLVGCHSPVPELTPYERQAGAAARQAWAASGLPEPDRERCDVDAWSIRTPDAQGYWDTCRSFADDSYGCMHMESVDGEWFFPRERPVVVVSPIWESEPGIIIHELLHAYIRCAGMRNGADPGDRKHSDPRVWEAAGGAESVQTRAMELIRPP